jgi:hypothetical protein
VLGESVRYAKERKQFGKTLAEFGLIQKKIAEMGYKIYTCDSMGYRCAGLIDATIAATAEKGSPDYDKKVIDALEEYNVEASILKVYGSERAGEIADEGVQLHGGYGYSEEYAVERVYRDARINRIFEGTNEINRMLIPGTLIKRSMKQQLALVPAFEKAKKMIKEPGSIGPFKGPLAEEKRLTEVAKAVTLWVFNHAFMKYMVQLQDKQEILGVLSDLIMDCYAMDSVVTRTEQNKTAKPVALDMARVSVREAYSRVVALAGHVVHDVSTEKEVAERLAELKRLPDPTHFSLLDAKRRIAAYFIERESYEV